MSSKNFVVVVVDGIIGAGKTVLINKCFAPLLRNKGMTVTIVSEPVEIWKESGRLQQFYDDPSRRGFQFQIRAFHDRVRNSQAMFREHGGTTDIFILERSIFTDMLFMKSLYESGTVDKSEFEDYSSLWEMWREVMPFSPDLFVYLKPSIDVAMTRILERNRGEEVGVTKNYQEVLEQKHDDFFRRNNVDISTSKDVPCYKLFTDENFRDNEDVKENIVNGLIDKIDYIKACRVMNENNM